jgi:hypothetical protein
MTPPTRILPTSARHEGLTSYKIEFAITFTHSFILRASISDVWVNIYVEQSESHAKE